MIDVKNTWVVLFILIYDAEFVKILLYLWRCVMVCFMNHGIKNVKTGRNTQFRDCSEEYCLNVIYVGMLVIIDC